VTTNAWPSESDDAVREPCSHQRPWTPDLRERVAAKLEALWRDPRYRSRQIVKMRAGWARRKRRLSGGTTR
jgi:hypothetical protein